MKTHRFRMLGVCMVVSLTVCSSVVTGSEDPIVWRWSNPSPHGNHIRQIAHRSGLFVQVTDHGCIYTSSDLDQWIPRTSGTTRSLQAVTFFGDRMVAIGERGTVLYADRPESFHALDLQTADWLLDLAATANQLVAVGDNGAVYTSPNGVDWQRRPQPFTAWLRGVAYGNGEFVAVGEDGFIATSLNGSDWQIQNSGLSAHLNSVDFVQGGFVIAGDDGALLTRANGQSWQPAGPVANPSFAALAGNDQSLVAAGQNAVWTRQGPDWRDETQSSGAAFPAPPGSYLSAVWDGSLFLLGGRSGLLVEGFRTDPVDRFDWVDRFESIRNWLWEIARLSDLYVAVGDHGTILSSEDGIAWTLELPPQSMTNAVLLGIGRNGTSLLAVGNHGRAMLSTNAVLWEAISLPTDNDLQGVASYDNAFVVTGGDGTILTSPNGRDWTPKTSGTTAFLSGIAAGPLALAAVGANGTLLTSPNAETWTPHASGTTHWIYRVRYLGDRFIAVGQNGTILTSPDGSVWTARFSGTDRWLNDVSRVGDWFFAAGTQGVVLRSRDGTTWQDAGTITSKSLYGLANHEGQLIAVGLEGAILRSRVVPFVTPVTIESYSHSAGKNVFLFSGQPDQPFTLDRSSDLTTWTPGPTLEFHNGAYTLIHLEESQPGAHKFFRGVSP